MEKILLIKNLSIGYQQRKTKQVVAKGINVSLRKGELVCLLGPNGAGKSTLMRTLSGAQKPLDGQIWLDGQNVHTMPTRQLAKNLSLVLTERVQAGMLTAYEVVALGRYPHINWTGKLGSKDHEVIEWSIDMVGANDLAHRVLAELSDGERQKVMVARALAQEPRVMILDEVTAFLDLPRRVEIMQLLRKLAHQNGKAILLSTHDMDLAMRSADRIWLLPKRGSLQVGVPEDLVLNGTFEKAFTSEGVSFNRKNGSFQIQQLGGLPIQLIGDGTVASWTRRALEREGFTIQPVAPLKVEVLTKESSPKWMLHRAGQFLEFASIGDLLDDIRSEK